MTAQSFDFWIMLGRIDASSRSLPLLEYRPPVIPSCAKSELIVDLKGLKESVASQNARA